MPFLYVMFYHAPPRTALCGSANLPGAVMWRFVTFVHVLLSGVPFYLIPHLYAAFRRTFPRHPCRFIAFVSCSYVIFYHILLSDYICFFARFTSRRYVMFYHALFFCLHVMIYHMWFRARTWRFITCRPAFERADLARIVFPYM